MPRAPPVTIATLPRGRSAWSPWKWKRVLCSAPHAGPAPSSSRDGRSGKRGGKRADPGRRTAPGVSSRRRGLCIPREELVVGRLVEVGGELVVGARRGRRTSRACRRRGSCSRTCSGRCRRARWHPRSTAGTPPTSIDCIGMARPESLHATLSRSAASTPMPTFQRSYSSGSFHHAANPCAPRTAGRSHPSSAAAASTSWSGCAMSSNNEPTVLQRLERSPNVGSRPPPPP